MSVERIREIKWKLQELLTQVEAMEKDALDEYHSKRCEGDCRCCNCVERKA